MPSRLENIILSVGVNKSSKNSLLSFDDHLDVTHCINKSNVLSETCLIGVCRETWGINTTIYCSVEITRESYPQFFPLVKLEIEVAEDAGVEVGQVVLAYGAVETHRVPYRKAAKRDGGKVLAIDFGRSRQEDLVVGIVGRHDHRGRQRGARYRFDRALKVARSKH